MHSKLPGTLLYTVHKSLASRYTYYTLHQLPGTILYTVHVSPASRYTTVHCTCIPSFQVHYCTHYIHPQLPGTLLYTVHASPASRYTTVRCAYNACTPFRYTTVHFTYISSFQVHYCTLYMHLHLSGIQLCTVPSFQVHLMFTVLYSQLPGTLLYTVLYSQLPGTPTVHCKCIPSFQVHLLYTVHVFPASMYTYCTLYMQFIVIVFFLCSSYQHRLSVIHNIYLLLKFYQIISCFLHRNV